jgi:ribonuclease HI
MTIPASLSIHIDGAARGNPGPAAFAYVIEGTGMPPLQEHGCLQATTNNMAEYTALIRALEKARQLGAKRLTIYSDSELLVKQMNGEYRVKNEDLQIQFTRAKALCRDFDLVTIRHIPRSENSRADRLCNQALDGEKKNSRPTSSKSQREISAREEAVTCLRAAAAAWARGNSRDPDPNAVWDQLWSILEEGGLLKKR